MLGYIPGDFALAALDCDNADAFTVAAKHPPRLILPSRTAGRWHLLYDAPPDDAGNGNWYFDGIKAGEVRHQTGYLALAFAAGDSLALELAHPRPGNFPFPWELLANHPRHPAQPAALGKAAASVTLPATPLYRLIYHPSELLGMREGDGRNNDLFNFVRTYAYGRDAWEFSEEDWRQEIIRYAGYGNRFFAEPLPDNEVRSVGKSVADYCRKHQTFRPKKGRHSSADPETFSQIQGCRAEIKARKLHADNGKRDRAIIRHWHDGQSQRQIANILHCSLASIGRVIRRYKANPNDSNLTGFYLYGDDGNGI